MYSFLYFLYALVQIGLAIYLVIPFLFVIIYSVLLLFRVRTPFQKKPFLTDKNFEFAIIITAHEETMFVPPLVDSILKQKYPGFFVYIVGDNCDPGELQFDDNRISVLIPQPSLHSKIKSIHYAIDRFSRKHDALIILDADNLIHPFYLEAINQYFQKGYRVVQTDFKPKNMDTTYARMDAMGDMFNFFIEREVRMRLGLSAAIWGSGVAIDLALYQEVSYSDFLGGFDKKLQSHLVTRVDRIAFSQEAVLFDEKITSGKSLENQRTRWISSYFKYFREIIGVLLTGIKKGDINLIYFGFITARPPLFIVIGCGIACLVLNYFIWPAAFFVWCGILLSFVLSFIIIVLLKGKDIRLLKSLLLMPLFVCRQVLALLKLKKAKKSFLKTKHSSLIYINDLVKEESLADETPGKHSAIYDHRAN